MSEETKKPLQKEFTAIGEFRQIDITPVDETNPALIAKTLEVQFGKLETWREGEAPKVAARFEVMYPRVVDGLEDHIKALAVDAKKAIAAAIAQSGRGTVDDYAFDLDDDYFKQTLDLPKSDPDNVWASDKFKDLREELAALRGDAEEALEVSEDAKENAQEEARKLAEVVGMVFEKVGGSRKALSSWAMGPDGSGNYPLLAKLGKGANALYETMLIGRLTDAQFAVLPSTITSGKGVVTHSGRAVGLMVDGIYQKEMKGDDAWPTGFHTKAGVRLPSVACAAAMLRRIALKGFGIENASELDLIGLADEVDQFAARQAGEFIVNFGKKVNTYDKDEYEAALRAFGRVTVSSGGDDLFRNIVTTLNRVNDMDMDDDEQRAKGVNELVKLYGNNLLFKKAVDTVWTFRNTVSKEDQNREVLKEVMDDDAPSPISKTAAKGFAQLDPLPAAAHLFKLLCTHGKSSEVWDNMKSLVSQQGLATNQAGDTTDDAE